MTQNLVFWYLDSIVLAFIGCKQIQSLGLTVCLSTIWIREIDIQYIGY